MATMKFTVPNWAQALIVRAINLDANGISVRLEDDRIIVLLEHKTGVEYIVNKATGKVVVA